MEYRVLSQPMVDEITKLVDDLLAEREAQRPAPIDADGVVSVPKAAKLTDYKPETIRKWIRQGRVTNYGRHGSPRVKVAEVLKAGV